MSVRLIICAILLILLPGCASTFPDITVVSERAEDTEFGGFSTYAWQAAAAIVNDPQGRWTPPDLDIGAEIVFLVNREMRKQGFTEVTRDPDVLLIYAVGIDMESLGVVVRGEDEGQIVDLPTGALALAMADAATLEVVWAGSAEAQIQEEADAELARRRLDFAITEMFERYPE